MTMKYVAIIIILAIVGVGFQGNWVVTPSTDLTDISVFGLKSQLKIFRTHLTTQDQLAFIDGVKNGLRTCSFFLIGALGGAYTLYVESFPDAMLWKIVWGILGIPLAILGGVGFILFGAIPAIIKRLLLVPADWSYYCGFISTCLVFIGAIAVVSKEKIQSRRIQA